MAARVTKHEHVWAMISHEEDFRRVLVSCQVRQCGKVQTWNQMTFRVQVAPRKYRAQTMDEFQKVWQPLEHQCCGT